MRGEFGTYIVSRLQHAVLGVPASMPPASSATYVPPACFPVDFVASGDPIQRLAQIDGFFRRNPGYASTSGPLDAARGAAARVPALRRFTSVFTPTELGYGQLLHDQMVWQQRSHRQPDNAWWMAMNAHLVQAPLRAEHVVRSGVGSADTSDPAIAAWTRYVQASDAVATQLGLSPGSALVPNRLGALQPQALSDVSRGARLLDRVVARTTRMTEARRALWAAHKTTLDHYMPQHAATLRAVASMQPHEARFGAAWANSVGHLAKLNPLATGRAAVIAHRILPPTQRVDPTSEPWITRAFVGALERLPTSTRTPPQRPPA